MLVVAGVDYTAQLWKFLLASDPLDETVALDEPELPDGVDEVKLIHGIATACGLNKSANIITWFTRFLHRNAAVPVVVPAGWTKTRRNGLFRTRA